MTNGPGLVVDIDGTMLDTNYLHVVAWARAFRANGYDNVTMADIHAAIGIASGQLVEYLTGRRDEAVSAAHSKEYEPFQKEARPLPGAADLLHACESAGIRVVVATSGAESDLDWMLPAIGVDDTTIVGATTSADVKNSKPAPDLIERAMGDHGLDPRQSVALGDTVWDVKAAAAAGVPCIAFLCGGIGEAALLDAGAIEVWGDPADLLDHLDESRLGDLVPE